MKKWGEDGVQSTGGIGLGQRVSGSIITRGTENASQRMRCLSALGRIETDIQGK